MSEHEEQTNVDLEQLLSELHGVGITPSDYTINISPTLSLVLSNISTQDEMDAILAAEEFEGHHWMQRIRCEVLSRAVHTINGTALTNGMVVKDPDRPEQTVLIRSAIKKKMLSWSPEFLMVIWKLYMVHCKNVEDRLLKTFPDSAVMTEYEQAFFQKTMRFMEQVTKQLQEDEGGLDQEGSKPIDISEG